MFYSTVVQLWTRKSQLYHVHSQTKNASKPQLVWLVLAIPFIWEYFWYSFMRLTWLRPLTVRWALSLFHHNDWKRSLTPFSPSMFPYYRNHSLLCQSDHRHVRPWPQSLRASLSHQSSPSTASCSLRHPVQNMGPSRKPTKGSRRMSSSHRTSILREDESTTLQPQRKLGPPLHHERFWLLHTSRLLPPRLAMGRDYVPASTVELEDDTQEWWNVSWQLNWLPVMSCGFWH